MAELIPPEISEDMIPLYQQEVLSLLAEMKILASTQGDQGEIAGDRLLQEAWSSAKDAHRGHTLEWIMDELSRLVSSQHDALLCTPEYMMQALENLLERCRQRLDQQRWASAEEVRIEIARRHQEGYYRSQAELLLLSQEIEGMIGAPVRQEDADTLAERLEREDFVRKMATVAPEVMKERQSLGSIHSIRPPQQVPAFFDAMHAATVH